MICVERLQRLRQHHEHCAKRYEEEITEKNQRDHDKNLQLIKMMKGQKTEEEEEKEMDCVTHGSLSESSHDLEIDYVPSESDSSNNSSCHDVNMKLTLKKNRKKLREADTTTAQELTNLYEKISSTDDNDKDADDQDTDYSADNEEEEEEEEERSQITVKFCIKGGKRKRDKRHYCVYCKKPQSKMARHLKRKHSDEKEVALAICLPPTSKKRCQMLEGLRRKGNYYHNIEVLQKGQGEIVTYRQPSEHTDPEEYLPCNICFAFFIKTKLWRHEKLCRKTMGVPEVQSKKRHRVQASASSLVPYRGQASQRCSNIVNRMIIDKVSQEVKNDPLICEFGDRLLEKHGSDQSKDGHVRQKMRELGRFVLAAKSIDSRVKLLQDVLVPPNFQLAVEAAKKASGFTKSKYRYDTPSLALKLGHSLKAVCDIVIGQHVKAEDEAAAARVRSFLGLISAEWDLFMSRRAWTNLEEDRWNKKEMLPVTEDVMKLNKVLKATEEAAKQELLDGPNAKAYRTLSECLLSQIILFNRRRQGEAGKITLSTYMNRAADDPNEDIMKGLSKLEQDLSHEFTRLVVRGKRSKKVPVLLTREMTKSLDFLIKQRSEDNDILDSNTYVFARQNSASHLRGSDCLRKYAAACGARMPETLTSTHLRKHVATMSQIMNLKENELDQLAKFMGHDIRVHREYYRLTENTLQLAKISKLLMAIELGTEVYKGKSLDEIDLGLESEYESIPVKLCVFFVCFLTECYVSVCFIQTWPSSSKVGAGQESQVSGSEAQDSDEEPDILTEKTPTPRPSRKLYRTEKTASSKEKRTRRISEPVQDSDEEPDILAQKTPTPRPSRKLYRTDKTGEPDILTQRTEKTAFPKGKKSRKITEPVQDSDEEQHILTQKTSTPRPSDKLKRTEKRGMDPQFLSQKKCHRRPWGSEEKAAVWRQLGQYSTLNRVPGKELCLKALDAEPILCHRDWRDVKNQVYNSITSQKMER
ncbi:uncharacterized protein LOC121622685 isoform X2 [Chelmon rostratus]|uniref:uncharacterized protein LOC121622685 isoform X2 n=1 Tax=Chelmon rostratus TaxID=109905 RepID=UPI001BECE8FC|nr:uncharacterized protein LOC121622685 isoform X2 [Chelmon rostratus]